MRATAGAMARVDQLVRDQLVRDLDLSEVPVKFRQAMSAVSPFRDNGDNSRLFQEQQW
jgi:hypothetical protein